LTELEAQAGTGGRKLRSERQLTLSSFQAAIDKIDEKADKRKPKPSLSMALPSLKAVTPEKYGLTRFARRLNRIRTQSAIRRGL